MNLTFNAQRTMKLELPNVDAKNGQFHGSLLTAVASTSPMYSSCCLHGTPWILVRSSPTAQATRAPI